MEGVSFWGTICLNYFGFGLMQRLLLLGACTSVCNSRSSEAEVFFFKVLFHIKVTINVLQVQPSPTTGKFPFSSGMESRNSALMMEDLDKRKENALESMNSSSFSFKPVPETAPSLFPGATSRVISLSVSQMHSAQIFCLFPISELVC